MVRAFIMILLLAVFFLSGTLYGMNHIDTSTESDPVIENQAVDPLSDNSSADDAALEKQIVNQDVMQMEDTHYTQNAATFLETSVQGFFEVVVGMLYQIAEVFF